MYNFSKVYLEQIKGSFGTVATLESEDRVTKKETTALAEKQLTEGSFLCHFEDFFKKNTKFIVGTLVIRLKRDSAILGTLRKKLKEGLKHCKRHNVPMG